MEPQREPEYFTEVDHYELGVPCSYWLLTSHVTGLLLLVPHGEVHQGSPAVFIEKHRDQVNQFHFSSHTHTFPN